jgi:hypothetical protein
MFSGLLQVSVSDVCAVEDESVVNTQRRFNSVESHLLMVGHFASLARSFFWLPA